MSYRLALIDLPGVIALLMNIALQYGASLEKAVDLVAGAKFAPCGPIFEHNPNLLSGTC